MKKIIAFIHRALKIVFVSRKHHQQSYYENLNRNIEKLESIILRIINIMSLLRYMETMIQLIQFDVMLNEANFHPPIGERQKKT